MAATGRITIVKRFTYRDALEEWSNQYWFTGTKPTASGSWKTLADAIINAEKPFLHSQVKFIRAYGYDADDTKPDPAEWTHDYLGPPDTSLAGSKGYLAADAAPGDAAAVVRWFTGRYNTKGKKIYCRKYFHGFFMSLSDPDEVDSTTKTEMQTYAAKMIDGTLPGGVKASDRLGSTLTDPIAMPYITTRTLKRRGKRPPS